MQPHQVLPICHFSPCSVFVKSGFVGGVVCLLSPKAWLLELCLWLATPSGTFSSSPRARSCPWVVAAVEGILATSFDFFSLAFFAAGLSSPPGRPFSLWFLGNFEIFLGVVLLGAAPLLSLNNLTHFPAGSSGGLSFLYSLRPLAT